MSRLGWRLVSDWLASANAGAIAGGAIRSVAVWASHRAGSHRTTVDQDG
jgi:hypothetical protein